jgi:hypothetical protein
MSKINIRRLIGDQLDANLDALASIIIASVDCGAAISFMQPMERRDAQAFWTQKVFPEVNLGNKILLAAFAGDKAVGTVQLDTKLPPNQPHRCEVAKMAVHPDFRRQGIAKSLMMNLESEAKAAKKSLITLDTKTGDRAQALYRNLGYLEAGTIPNFALDPDGKELHSTTYMYKMI